MFDHCRALWPAYSRRTRGPSRRTWEDYVFGYYDLPHSFSGHVVEGFRKVHKCEIEVSVFFCGFLELFESENYVIYAPLVPEAKIAFRH